MKSLKEVSKKESIGAINGISIDRTYSDNALTEVIVKITEKDIFVIKKDGWDSMKMYKPEVNYVYIVHGSNDDGSVKLNKEFDKEDDAKSFKEENSDKYSFVLDITKSSKILY